jgi:hypothetical protein
MMLYPRQTTLMKALYIVLRLCSTRARCYLILTDHKAALKGLVQVSMRLHIPLICSQFHQAQATQYQAQFQPLGVFK